MDKNTKAWNAGAFPYKTIVYKVITDPQALANAVVSGQVDVGGALDSTTVDLVKSKQSVVSSGGTIVGFPVLDKTGATNPAFAKTPTSGWRSATASTARPSSRTCTRRRGRPRSSSRKGTPGFDPALNEEFAYDPAKAKQLLAAAGYPNLPIDITVLGQPTEDQIAVQDQWKKIGVTLNFKTGHLHRPAVRRRAHQPLAFGPFARRQQPAGFVAGVVVGGFMNLQQGHDPAIERRAGQGAGRHRCRPGGRAEGPQRARSPSRAGTSRCTRTTSTTATTPRRWPSPGLAGTNGYLVLSSIKSAELTAD